MQCPCHMQRFSCLFAHTPGACGGTPAPGRAVPGTLQGTARKVARRTAPEAAQKVLRGPSRMPRGSMGCSRAQLSGAAVRHSCQAQQRGRAWCARQRLLSLAPRPGCRVPCTSQPLPCAASTCVFCQPSGRAKPAAGRTAHPNASRQAGAGCPSVRKTTVPGAGALAGIGWHQSLPGRSDGRVAVPYAVCPGSRGTAGRAKSNWCTWGRYRPEKRCTERHCAKRQCLQYCF